jgi:hypothetical protein
MSLRKKSLSLRELFWRIFGWYHLSIIFSREEEGGVKQIHLDLWYPSECKDDFEDAIQEYVENMELDGYVHDCR